MTFSTTLGSGGRRGPSTSASSRTLAAAARDQARAEKAEEGRALAEALSQILDLHRPDFPEARRPVAPAPPPPVVETIRAKHRQAALAGIGLLNRTARAQAKAAADHVAQQEIQAIDAANRQRHQEYQEYLDEVWGRLGDNDPEVVLAVLAEAFEDNEAAAAPLGVEGAEASLVVLVPAPSAVPERRPTTTSTGNLSLKKLTKRELADFYKLLVCGYVLVTVKEALAVAPGLESVRILAVRATSPDAYGRMRLEPLLGAQFRRERLAGVRWDTADAVTVVNDASSDLTLQTKGPWQELVALDLRAEPSVAAAMEVLDVDDLI